MSVNDAVKMTLWQVTLQRTPNIISLTYEYCNFLLLMSKYIHIRWQQCSVSDKLISVLNTNPDDVWIGLLLKVYLKKINVGRFPLFWFSVSTHGKHRWLNDDISYFLSEWSPSSNIWYLDVAFIDHSLCLCHWYPEQNVRQLLTSYFVVLSAVFIYSHCVSYWLLQAVSHHLMDVCAGLGPLSVWSFHLQNSTSDYRGHGTSHCGKWVWTTLRSDGKYYRLSLKWLHLRFLNVLKHLIKKH